MSLNLLLLALLLYVAVLPNTRGEGEIRLVNGRNNLEGRVEIFHDGRWGTICDDNWTNRNAHVVCQQLGLGYAMSTLSRGFFRGGTGPIAMDEVNCVGDEERLEQCPFRGWFLHNCLHQQDVGVQCSSEDGGIRLVGGTTPYEGRVEFFYGGRWGTVCDEGWDINNAIVVCRKLGLGFPEKAVRGACYGEGKGEIFLSNVVCDGTENGLEECSHSGFLSHSCSHNQDAGVECRAPALLTDKPCKNFEVRIVDHSVASESLVEVCYKGVWGNVCGTSWGVQEAHVVCRQLGHDSLVTFYSLDTTDDANNRIVERLTCEENQSLLLNCDIEFNNSNCTTAAAVVCSGKLVQVMDSKCTSGTIRLVDGPSYYSGKIEMCDSGIWVDLHATIWGIDENHLVCTTLGYHGASDFVLTQPLPDFEENSFIFTGCSGTETTVSQCSFEINDGSRPIFEVNVSCSPGYSNADIFWIFCLFLTAFVTAISVAIIAIVCICAFACGCLIGCCCKEVLED